MTIAAFIAGGLLGCLAGRTAYKVADWHRELTSSRAKARRMRGLRARDATTLFFILSATAVIAWKIGR